MLIYTYCGSRAQDPEAGKLAIQTTAALMGSKKQHAPTIFTGVLLLLKAAIRQHTLVRVVQEDLTKMMLPPHCVSSIVTALRARYVACFAMHGVAWSSLLGGGAQAFRA